MKLFIWNSPYRVDYGGSCIYAVADTEEQAREVALKANVSKFGYTPREIAGGFDLGPPDRVLEGPCAECYEWSE